MNFINIFKRISFFSFKKEKKLDVKKLPSQGLFYKDDFKIYIKKANTKDITEYEYDYDSEDLGLIIYKLKNIVEKNTILSEGYNFYDIKSIDIVFLFLEIVKFSKSKPIKINYIDEKYGTVEDIDFDSKYFNYFKLDQDLIKSYDNENKQFIINGYKYTLPSIGIENCLTNYLISKSDDPSAFIYNKYNYDFTFFLGYKKTINFDEIDNLIQIFNFDMEDIELNKVKDIVKKFESIQRYSLIKGDKIIEINSKIDLKNIWK